MDRIDERILNILQADARTTNLAISEAVKMAPSAVLERIRKLEAKGIIDSYATLLNKNKVNRGMLAFVFCRVSSSNWSDSASKALAKIPSVLEVHEICGKESYLLKVRVKDHDHLSDVLKKEIAGVKDVVQTNTTLALKSVKDEVALPLSEALFTKKGRAK